MMDFSARLRRDGVRSLLAVALASVSSFALSAPAQAQAPDAAAPTAQAERDYNIPAQPLSTALLRFAEQSDLQILFGQQELEGFVSAPVVGRFTSAQALSVLMSRSDLEARITPAGAVAIEAAAMTAATAWAIKQAAATNSWSPARAFAAQRPLARTF
ncbi:hypothetical protein [Terricaulis sp.]|uniref:hypothetical protein n=1 Tax=Terricaulis sp. TaxID=2768686 RepID=UPI002AC6A7A7|nr:hypothetical protein [Terricaulis sp.]MDZ4690965.1 hypothetical protein [Terricaulis sp.]